LAPAAEDAAERRSIARDRLDKIARGESVDGGLGQPRNIRKMFTAAGWTEADLRRAVRLASLTEAELRSILRSKAYELYRDSLDTQRIEWLIKAGRLRREG
jgi:hypothetical protein